MGRPTKAIEEAILGLDIGSTSSRAVLYSKAGKEIVVEHPGKGDPNRYEAGDQSSSCYPFDNHPAGPYIGNALDPARTPTSLKPIFLLLSGIDQGDLEPLMEQYPQGYVLLEKKNSQSKHARRAFEKKLLQVLDLFFKALRDQVLAVCKDEGLRVTSVGITIPGQWPAVVEDFFTRTVMKTLLKKETHIQVPRGNIYFHTETQALGHYIFEHRADLLRQYGTNKGTFLLADFGGQNLNVSTFYVQLAPDDAVTFFEIDRSTGVIGGSEQQDYYIGEYCEAYYRNRGKELSPDDKQHLINMFHRQKKELDANHDGPKNARTLSCGKTAIDLSPEKIGAAFDWAMERPLEKMKGMLEALGRSKDRCRPRVIITGGSARSEALEEQLCLMCEENKLKFIFVHLESMRTGTRYPSLNIAKGAAYATANDMTVKAFIDRGAAIGVQDQEREQCLEIKQGDELKLICDPFRKPGLRRDDIHFQRAYDVYALGTFNRGKATLSATFYPGGDGHEPKLVFKIRWWPGRGGGPIEYASLHGTVSLPLRFDKSSSCVLVDEGAVENNLPARALVHSNHDPPRHEILDSEDMELEFLTETSASTDTASMSEDEGCPGAQSAPFANMHPEFTADSIPFPGTGLPARLVSPSENDAPPGRWAADSPQPASSFAPTAGDQEMAYCDNDYRVPR